MVSINMTHIVYLLVTVTNVMDTVILLPGFVGMLCCQSLFDGLPYHAILLLQPVDLNAAMLHV